MRLLPRTQLAEVSAAAVWPRRRLEEIVLKCRQEDPRKSGHDTFTYVDVSAVSSDTLSIVAPQRVAASDAPSRARQVLHSGDVLFATVRPGLRRIALVPPELDGAVGSTGYCVLRPVPEMVDSEYLYFCCITPQFVERVAALQKGSSYPAVRNSDILSQSVPLPPLDEQRRIAAILTTVQRAKKARIQRASALTNLWRSTLENLLGSVTEESSWLRYPLPELIDYQEGPGVMAADFRTEGVPLIRLAGLTDGINLLAACNYLDPEKVGRRWNHFRLQIGDTLLSSSASLGRVAVLNEAAVGAVAYTGIIRMRPRDERIIPDFIRFVLLSPDFQQQTEAAGIGTVMRHFGPSHLRGMTVRVPRVAEQRRIVHVLQTVMQAKQHDAASTDQLSTTFEAVLAHLIDVAA